MSVHVTHLFFSPSHLLFLRSCRSKYNTASTINYLLVFFLHFDLKWIVSVMVTCTELQLIDNGFSECILVSVLFVNS